MSEARIAILDPLPCPFCGCVLVYLSEREIALGSDHCATSMVCARCRACGPEEIHDSDLTVAQEDAVSARVIEAWNRRVGP